MNWNEENLKNGLVSEEVDLNGKLITFEITKQFMSNYDLRFKYEGNSFHIKYGSHKKELMEMCENIHSDNSTIKNLILNYIDYTPSYSTKKKTNNKYNSKMRRI